jgi:OPT oligopeptide transporter protein
VSDKKNVALLLTFPICKLWARYLPNVTFFGVSLNPGPFTIKEHVIIITMASVREIPAYAVSAAQVADYVNPFLLTLNCD